MIDVMNSNPLVTIGIPVYNCERFISQAVKSVLNQTYTNFELIITDDGSKDRTVEILRSFDDPRIKLIADGENHGISYRLNQQIDLAKGKYFVRMDGDDIMFPNRVEEQVKYLETHPDVDVVGSKSIIIDDENEILGFRGDDRRIRNIDDLFKSTRFMHPTVAGRAMWFQKWKYRENMAGCEDYDLWIRSYNDSCFDDINEPLMFYRDPLIFKLATYISRQKKLIRCAWSLKEYMTKRTTFIVILLKSVASSIVSYLLQMCGKDSLVISRRNKEVVDKDIYEVVLRMAVK